MIVMNMQEQFEEARTIINDIVFSYISDMEDIDGECEDREEIEAALKLLLDLAKKSVTEQLREHRLTPEQLQEQLLVKKQFEEAKTIMRFFC